MSNITVEAPDPVTLEKTRMSDGTAMRAEYLNGLVKPSSNAYRVLITVRKQEDVYPQTLGLAGQQSVARALKWLVKHRLVLEPTRIPMKDGTHKYMHRITQRGLDTLRLYQQAWLP